MLAPTVRFLAAAALLTAAGAAVAQPKTRADCERAYKPQVGQQGKDVVWVPTPDELVARMMSMAQVGPKDYVIDLGAGDGKIAIAAAKNHGATSLGIEYNPDMVRLAQCMVQVEGVAGRTRIVQGDIFKEDFSKADVITMYLLPQLNLCVRHRILAMRPGTRVTSHQFSMGDWDADEQADFEHRTAYLWIVPARVEGSWVLRDGAGTYPVTFTQRYQKLTGDVQAGGTRAALAEPTLRGDTIRFGFRDGAGAVRTFSGQVRGNEIVGTARGPGGESKATLTLQGAVRTGSWADMADGCGQYYGK
jgi:hypothetical protein